MQSIWRPIVNQDVFGHAIGLHYKGQDSYKTRVGALITLLSYSLIIFYLVGKFSDYLDHST